MSRGFDDSHGNTDHFSKISDTLERQSVLDLADTLSPLLADAYSALASNWSVLKAQCNAAVEIAEAIGRIPDIAQRSLSESVIVAAESFPLLSSLDQLEIPNYIHEISGSLPLLYN